MKKKYLIALCIISILFLGGVFRYALAPSPQICCNWLCFDLELAQTDEEREQGLMQRNYLEGNKGMLFIFSDEGIYPFRMKNTLIWLDIIRLDSNFQIVDIQEAIPCREEPCSSYVPSFKAQYVLEINQGISTKNWIVSGTTCVLSQ